VPLTPEAFDLLVYLVERHGRLAEKSALMSALCRHLEPSEARATISTSAAASSRSAS
jgi:DNA-binding winged helix-turn-helix (wHTH) protein